MTRRLAKRARKRAKRVRTRLLGSCPDFHRSRPGLTIHLSISALEVRLQDLFAHYGSDKGWDGHQKRPYPWHPHNYAEVYEFLFQDRRHRVRSLVECGIGTTNTDIPSNMTPTGRPGASLRAWRDYFPEATIYGLDIDERILFTEDRIRTAAVDQTDRERTRSFFEDSRLNGVDIIIDDGLHTFEAGVAFFEAAFPHLAEDGIYVIEDVQEKTLLRFHEYFASRAESVAFLQVHRVGHSLGDNTLIVVRRAVQA